jgi:hypothetical protein
LLFQIDMRGGFFVLTYMFEAFNEASRKFEYDYIIIDAVFLSIWLTILIKKKKWSAIKFGIFTSIIVYFIDAIMWWNIPAGANYPKGTNIREYWIGGIKVPQSLGEFFWWKFGADFMMCFSYAMFAFGWLWIMFEDFSRKKNKKEMGFFTLLFFGSWLAIPFLSIILPLNDISVETVRHTDTQMLVWIINVFIGYSLLIIIYGTNRFNCKNFQAVWFVFLVGCLESFFMEFPLFLSRIRSTGLSFLIYEIFFLFNQGAPYLFIMYDKLFPWLFEINSRRDKKNLQLIEIQN